jgi:hypothetical protein
MQSFKDSTGRDWTISINALNLRNASQKHGFKIIKAVDSPPDELTVDKLKDTDIFLDVLHMFLVPAVEFDAFLAAIDGDTFYEAGKAFYLELANFTQPQQKGLNEMRVKKADEVMRMADAKAKIEMEAISSESILSMMMKNSGNLSTDSLDTPEPEQPT